MDLSPTDNIDTCWSMTHLDDRTLDQRSTLESLNGLLQSSFGNKLGTWELELEHCSSATCLEMVIWNKAACRFLLELGTC